MDWSTPNLKMKFVYVLIGWIPFDNCWKIREQKTIISYKEENFL